MGLQEKEKQNMMDIRFRVWDNINKRFYHHFDLPDQYLMGLDGAIWDTKAPDEFGLGLGNVVNDRFELQQWTGLKDKNGKEIYEGDIISYFDKIVAVVVWQDYGGWSYKWIDPTYIKVRQHNPEPFFHNISLAEVVGNIYEHPELLKQV